MVRSFSIILGILSAAFFVGCLGDVTPPQKPSQPRVIRNGKVFQYPFGVFWGLGADAPVIDSAQIEHTDIECPLVWVDDEAIDFSKENAESLRQKYGDQLKEAPGGKPGFELTAVTKFTCIVHIDERGEITSVYLYTVEDRRPCLSRTRDSERLFLKCSADDVERCFGPPVRVTEF